MSERAPAKRRCDFAPESAAAGGLQRPRAGQSREFAPEDAAAEPVQRPQAGQSRYLVGKGTRR